MAFTPISHASATLATGFGSRSDQALRIGAVYFDKGRLTGADVRATSCRQKSCPSALTFVMPAKAAVEIEGAPRQGAPHIQGAAARS
jgi:hypothetical protein